MTTPKKLGAISAIPADWSNPCLLTAAAASPIIDDFQVIDDWLPVKSRDILRASFGSDDHHHANASLS